jgi:hypothetical protein
MDNTTLLAILVGLAIILAIAYVLLSHSEWKDKAADAVEAGQNKVAEVLNFPGQSDMAETEE